MANTNSYNVKWLEVDFLYRLLYHIRLRLKQQLHKFYQFTQFEIYSDITIFPFYLYAISSGEGQMLIDIQAFSAQLHLLTSSYIYQDKLVYKVVVKGDSWICSW